MLFKEKGNAILRKIKEMKLQDWQNLLVPEFVIDAITIEDRMVQVFGFNKKKRVIDKVGAYALPPGVIEEGILKKPKELQSFFLSLRQKLWGERKKVWIILSLPSANFYTNILSIPTLGEERFREAVVFNTQINTPLPLEESYFDWEDWGPAKKEDEREVFVALGIKKQIDAYLQILQASDFKVVAVEPFALSLSRFLYQFSGEKEPVLSIDLRQEGMEFIILEGKKLVFFDFDSWSEIFDGKIPSRITIGLLKKHLAKEVPMLLNFYLLKRGKNIHYFFFGGKEKMLVAALRKEMESSYHLLPLSLKLPSYLTKLSSAWYGVIGAALRGLLPRRRDTIVSLAPVGTEQEYYRNHLYSVVSLWLKATATIMIILVGLLGSMNSIFFRRIMNNYRQNLAAPLETATQQKDEQLTKQAKEFNALVNQVSAVNQYNRNWGKTIRSIFTAANISPVTIKRMLISASPAKNITVLGIASSKTAVVNFKTSLDGTKMFSQINLPLDALVETPTGVSFSLNLKL